MTIDGITHMFLSAVKAETGKDLHILHQFMLLREYYATEIGKHSKLGLLIFGLLIFINIPLSV